jgi:predicted amidohydrolase
MKVAACQLPEIRNDTSRAVAVIRGQTLEAQRAGADLVCFPECFLQGYAVDPAHIANVAIDLSSPAFRDLLEELKPLEPVIVVGLIEKEGGDFYNTAVAIERGTVVARYRKTYLLRGEQSVFQPGEAFPVFDVLGVRIGINICYDLNFSESVQRASDAGVTLLACPCSNMMRRDAAEKWKPRHNEIRSRQARDHGVWILSADVTGERDGHVSYGPTAVIDPTGTVVAQVPLSETGMVVAEIEYIPERQRVARY